MKKYLLVFLLAYMGTANAAVIDFESGLSPLFTYSGVNTLVTNDTTRINSGYNTLGVFTGTPSVAFNPSEVSPSTFSWAGPGATFDLNSFVIAGAWGSQTLTIDGLFGGQTIFSSLLAVTNSVVSTFNAGWTGIDAFRITTGNDFILAGNVTGSGQHWALDNLTVNEAISPVPVPAAAWLFGSALLGLVGFRRRNKI